MAKSLRDLLAAAKKAEQAKKAADEGRKAATTAVRAADAAASAPAPAPAPAPDTKPPPPPPPPPADPKDEPEQAAQLANEQLLDAINQLRESGDLPEGAASDVLQRLRVRMMSPEQKRRFEQSEARRQGKQRLGVELIPGSPGEGSPLPFQLKIGEGESGLSGGGFVSEPQIPSMLNVKDDEGKVVKRVRRDSAEGRKLLAERAEKLEGMEEDLRDRRSATVKKLRELADDKRSPGLRNLVPFRKDSSAPGPSDSAKPFFAPPLLGSSESTGPEAFGRRAQERVARSELPFQAGLRKVAEDVTGRLFYGASPESFKGKAEMDRLDRLNRRLQAVQEMRNQIQRELGEDQEQE